MFNVINLDNNRIRIEFLIDGEKEKRINQMRTLPYIYHDKFMKIIRPYKKELKKLEEDDLLSTDAIIRGYRTITDHLFQLWLFNNDPENLKRLIEDVLSDNELPDLYFIRDEKA
jgi:hypothetical protein